MITTICFWKKKNNMETVKISVVVMGLEVEGGINTQSTKNI